MGRRMSAAERDLLDLLDEGEPRSAPERALLLARVAAGWRDGRARDDPAVLPLGRRDRLILDLHAALFGTKVEAQDSCPQCGQLVTFTLTVDALNDVPPTASEPVRVELDGCTVTCRLLTGGDLLAATAPGAAGAHGRGALLAAAVLTAEREGAPVAPIDLPAPVVDAVVDALARADPFAELRLHLLCEVCGHAWDAVLDLAHFVWCEVRDWGRRLVRDVHMLARAYGWREGDVLALPHPRREAYLRLVLDG